jgi:hypothetical protein
MLCHARCARIEIVDYSMLHHERRPGAMCRKEASLIHKRCTWRTIERPRFLSRV